MKDSKLLLEEMLMLYSVEGLYLKSQTFFNYFEVFLDQQFLWFLKIFQSFCFLATILSLLIISPEPKRFIFHQLIICWVSSFQLYWLFKIQHFGAKMLFYVRCVLFEELVTSVFMAGC